MSHISTTFAHGNGPFSRAIDLALAVNERLKEKGNGSSHIIVPLVYGDRQKKIMHEDFGHIVDQDPNAFLLDPFYGGILKQILFPGGDYQEYLKNLVKNYSRLEEQLRNYLAGKLKLQRFDGKEVEINGDDVGVEVSHNPKVVTGYKNSFYTTIGYFSEIMHKAALESGLGFNLDILKEAEGIANRIEEDKKVHFMPEPFVFSYDKERKRWKNEIFTPPFIHMPTPNNEDVEKGMYVMVTGLDGLKGLFGGVHDFGMKLYCPPFIKLEDADNTHAPDFIVNPNILCQFGRTGWSTVWLSHMTETPLIAPAYARVQGDDPEIYFNEKSIKKLGLAVVFTGTTHPKEVLEKALSNEFRYNLRDINEALIRNYKTLDGMNYTADAVVAYLKSGEFGISEYRRVEPVLNKLF